MTRLLQDIKIHNRLFFLYFSHKISFFYLPSLTMFSVFSFGDTPSSQGRRGPSWSSLETMLLIECYAIYLPILESSGSDFETGEAYRNLKKEYDEKAQHANVPPRELEPIKSKWKSLVENYKKEFTRRSTTGESGFAPDEIYDKLDEILQDYPTIRPPHIYSFQTRRFTDNTAPPPVPVPSAEANPLPSSSSSHPSSSTFKHVRPSMSEDLEPPTSRRRTVPPQSSPPRQTTPSYQPSSPSFYRQPPPSFRQPSPSPPPSKNHHLVHAKSRHLDLVKSQHLDLANHLTNQYLLAHDR